MKRHLGERGKRGNAQQVVNPEAHSDLRNNGMKGDAFTCYKKRESGVGG